MKKKLLSFPLHHLSSLKSVVCNSVLLMTLMLFSTDVYSQAELVKDVNRLENVMYAEYAELTPANNTLFFTSQREDLWNTDGSTAGTIRYKQFSSISDLIWIGSTLYFVGGTDGGRELCKSNGPGAATGRIKNIRPGPEGSDPEQLTNVNGLLYFVADDGQHGPELWKSDGTAAGTVMVKDIFPGGFGSNLSQLTNVNGILYFAADDFQHGTELWKSDGTASGTVMVKDINPGTEGSDPEWFTQMNGRLYFIAFHPESGRELWRSNGAGSGTVLIKEFAVGTDSPIMITELVTMGNAIYFVVNDVLWRSSGTSYGTAPVKDLSPETDLLYGVTYYLTPVNGKLYFAANGGLWISDGTSRGTRRVIDLELAVNPQFTAYHGNIFYVDYYFNEDEYAVYYRFKKMDPDGMTFSEIWRTPSYNFDNEIPTFEPELTTANNLLFFYGIPGKGLGHKLMKSDGTPEGTVIIKDTYQPTVSSNPTGLVNSNGLVYFKSQGEHEWYQYVYRTDGTSAGTFPIKKLEPFEIIVAGGNVFFTGYSEGYWQLWKTNGTVAGTVLMKQVPYETEGIIFSRSYATVNGTLLFSTTEGELWKSDGTPSGTVAIKKFNKIGQIVSAGNQAYLLARGSSGEEEIWKTNGTAEGTIKIEALQPAPGFQPAYYFFENNTLNGITYFFGTDGSKGHEIWRTNGTASGTYRIKVIQMNDPGENVPPVHSMVVYKNSFYFSAFDEQRESSLYKSNGTSYSTIKIAKMEPIIQYIPLSEKLLLFPFHTNTESGYRAILWITDGTIAGTKPVKTIDDGSYFRMVDYEVVNGSAYFINWEGYQLWRTDGTECGTFSLPTGITMFSEIESIGNNLIFGGLGDYKYGNELYRYNVTNAPPNPCVTEMASNTGAFVENEMTSSDAQLITFAPNPFNDVFSFKINSSDQTHAQLTIYSLNGTVVESTDMLTCNTTHHLGQSWTPGLYLVSIRIGNIFTTRKVIKN